MSNPLKAVESSRIQDQTLQKASLKRKSQDKPMRTLTASETSKRSGHTFNHSYSVTAEEQIHCYMQRKSILKALLEDGMVVSLEDHLVLINLAKPKEPSCYLKTQITQPFKTVRSSPVHLEEAPIQ